MTCCGAFLMPTDLPAPPPPPAAPFRLGGRFVLASMLGFFAVVAGANAVMMTAAIRTMPGVDVKSAYETSQRFNDEIARMRAQSARGWNVDAALRHDGSDTLVTVSFLDRLGAPVTGLAVEAKLQHPATRAHDRDERLAEQAPGHYAARLPALHAGAWTLAITGKRDGEAVFDTRSRVLLKD
jgi:nitrogen fixation protein FixH